MAEQILDDIDKQVLYQLQEDGRRKISATADAVGVSDNTVRNRLERLEQHGIITGYHVALNYNHTGNQHHYQFVCTAPVSAREEVASRSVEVDGVVEVRTLMTGSKNVYVTAVAESIESITEIALSLDSIEPLTIELEDLIYQEKRQPLSSFDTRDEKSDI